VGSLYAKPEGAIECRFGAGPAMGTDHAYLKAVNQARVDLDVEALD